MPRRETVMPEIVRVPYGTMRRRHERHVKAVAEARKARPRARREDYTDLSDLERDLGACEALLARVEHTAPAALAAPRDGNPATAGTGHGFKSCGGKRHSKQRLRQGSPRKGKGRGGRVGTARLDPQHERPSRVEVKGPGLRRGILDVIAGVKHG